MQKTPLVLRSYVARRGSYVCQCQRGLSAYAYHLTQGWLFMYNTATCGASTLPPEGLGFAILVKLCYSRVTRQI